MARKAKAPLGIRRRAPGNSASVKPKKEVLFVMSSEDPVREFLRRTHSPADLRAAALGLKRLSSVAG